MPDGGDVSAPSHPRRPARLATRALDWVLRWGEHPAGPAVLVLLALLEATVFPAPTEALLIALALGRPRRAWLFAALATVSSVAGGAVGYWMGGAAYEDAARLLLAAWGMLPHLDAVARVYRENFVLALVTSGYTPIPYMLYTIAAGAFELPFGPFVAGSFVGRALKYAPLALLAYLFGPAVRRLLDRYAGWVIAAVVLLLATVLVAR